MLMIALAGCLSPIDIEISNERAAGLLVVSGQVSNLEHRTFVDVGVTSADGRYPIPLNNIEVVLSDESGLSNQLTELTNYPGRYTADGFTGEPGKRYILQIRAEDGSIYTSEFESMPLKAGVDDLSNKFLVEEFTDYEGAFVSDARINVYSTPTIPKNGFNFIRWTTEETYLIRPTNFPDPFGYQPPDCFVTENADPQRIVLFDGRSSTGNFTKPILLCSRKIDQSFHYKHYFTIYQSSMSESAFEYWKKVDVLANQTGSIFDSPPATIKGNLSNRSGKIVFGYFQAVNETFKRFSVVKSDLPEFASLEAYCDFSYERRPDSYPGSCLDCLSVRNSTITRPDWF